MKDLRSVEKIYFKNALKTYPNKNSKTIFLYISWKIGKLKLRAVYTAKITYSIYSFNKIYSIPYLGNEVESFYKTHGAAYKIAFLFFSFFLTPCPKNNRKQKILIFSRGRKETSGKNRWKKNYFNSVDFNTWYALIKISFFPFWTTLFWITNTGWRASVFEVFLVRIFPPLDLIRRDTSKYLSVFRPNTGK